MDNTSQVDNTEINVLINRFLIQSQWQETRHESVGYAVLLFRSAYPLSGVLVIEEHKTNYEQQTRNILIFCSLLNFTYQGIMLNDQLLDRWLNISIIVKTVAKAQNGK